MVPFCRDLQHTPSSFSYTNPWEARGPLFLGLSPSEQGAHQQLHPNPIAAAPVLTRWELMSIILGTAEHQKALVASGSHPITLEQGGAGPRSAGRAKTQLLLWWLCCLCDAPQPKFLHEPTHSERASEPRRFISSTAGDFGGADVEREGQTRSHWKYMAEARA